MNRLLAFASVTLVASLCPSLALAQTAGPSAAPLARVSLYADEEPTRVVLETPSGQRSEPCTTPCSFTVLPSTYTIRAVDGSNAWRTEVLDAGSHGFALRAPRVSGGGVALTVLGSIGLALGAVFIPLGIGARSWDALLYFTIGIPSAVIGAAEFIPGVVIVSRGRYRAIDRVPPTLIVTQLAPFIPSASVSF
ncbi:MAG: hypothetical protein U0269_27505 [Polyangiales bacterium]